MRNIILVGMARESSTRILSKMTRPFCDTTLYEIYLKKFEEIMAMKHPFSKIIMAINKNNKTLWELSRNTTIEIAERDDYSVEANTVMPSEIQKFLSKYKENFVLNVNGCCPFLKPETIIKLADYFIQNESIKSITCVRKRANHFWDMDTHKPINNIDPTCLNTKALKPIYENVNSMLVYSRKRMLETNSYWDYTKDHPHLYVLPDDIECLDIDTESEFKICETLWRGKATCATLT